MASTITTSIVTGGDNSHATTSAEANAVATDFIHGGVVGPITNTSGVAPNTGSFAVNAQATPAMFVDVTAGSAWITATPSGQVSQKLRAYMSADYTSYAISSNSSGSTKYDWIYLKVDATAANNPASDASDVVSLYTSRSSSNTTDNGTPPTYGQLLAVVAVANGASSISNSNITDKRRIATFRSSPATSAVNSVDITASATGTALQISATGDDANIDLDLRPKGTGVIKFNGVSAWQSWTPTFTGLTLGNGTISAKYMKIGKTVFCQFLLTWGSTTSASGSLTATIPVTATSTFANDSMAIGVARLRDDSASAKLGGIVKLATTTTIGFASNNSLSAVIDVTATSPWTWATSDMIGCSFTYEAA